MPDSSAFSAQPAGVVRRSIVIVGGTSTMAAHCARLWLKAEPARVLLIGRSESRLQRVAADLAVRSPESGVEYIATDLADTAAIEKAAAKACAESLPTIVLIAHGALPDQTTCEHELPACRSALEVNALSPALWIEAFLSHMEGAGPARIIVIGSVAGDRGRQSNYVRSEERL